ncbi:hypothetical protein GALL_456470 [mine drainage metagenome]|uniref:Uncharacterized protein n=1 Tax=mine drainage metagenome TaxID=410659 RepID=A0A1J5Q9R5_9ZZZZ
MNDPAPINQRDENFTLWTGLFVCNRQQLPHVGTRRNGIRPHFCYRLACQHRHGNTHGGTVSTVHPWVVGNGKHQFGFGGFSGGERTHSDISAVGHLCPRSSQGFDIAVTQRFSHLQFAHKRRVTNDEIGLRPGRLTRPDVAPLRHLRRLIRHRFTRHRMCFESDTVPAAEQLTGGVALGTDVPL